MQAMLDSVWNSIAPFQTQLISLAVTLFALFIAWLFRARVKLIYGRANNSLNQVRVPDPQDSQKSTFTEIYVEKFFLQNVGRKPATEVEFVLSNFPTDINIFQPQTSRFRIRRKRRLYGQNSKNSTVRARNYRLRLYQYAGRLYYFGQVQRSIGKRGSFSNYPKVSKTCRDYHSYWSCIWNCFCCSSTNWYLLMCLPRCQNC